MKKRFLILAALTTMVITTPALADLPDSYTSAVPEELYEIDVDSLTEEELRTAYSTLRDTYAACFQALVNESTKNDISVEPTPTPTPVPVTDSIWEIRYYVDDFQEPTDDAYISTVNALEGKFSNSATTNSPLFVWFVIDNYDVGIKLIEYSDNVVKGYYDDGHPFNITMRYGGTEREMTGMLYDGGDRVYVDSKYLKIFRKALRSGEEIKLYLENTTDRSSYLFTIPASTGFAELYDQAF